MSRELPLVRLLPVGAELPRSWTADLGGERGYFNQYVLPPALLRFSAMPLHGPLSVQCWADGTPIQMIVWKNNVEVSRLTIPDADRRWRAVFDIPVDREDWVRRGYRELQRLADGWRLQIDPDVRAVCFRLGPEVGQRCHPMATRTLAEVTSDLRLTAVWMLEVDRDRAEYHRFHERIRDLSRGTV